MPKNWICTITKENFDRMRDHKIWGVKKEHKIKWEKVEVSDVLVFYIMGEMTIGGVFKVSNAPFTGSKRIFAGDAYPLRMKVEEILVPEKPIPFSPELRAKLEFIVNKKMWIGSLRSTMRLISDKDLQILMDALRRKS